MNFKEIGTVFTSKFVGPRALVFKKKNYLPGRGLTKFGKHWAYTIKVCVSTHSHNDEIARRRVSHNVSPSLSDAYL
jgi:hypothetical protein